MLIRSSDLDLFLRAQNNYCITAFFNDNPDINGLHLQLDHMRGEGDRTGVDIRT